MDANGHAKKHISYALHQWVSLLNLENSDTFKSLVSSGGNDSCNGEKHFSTPKGQIV